MKKWWKDEDKRKVVGAKISAKLRARYKNLDSLNQKSWSKVFKGKYTIAQEKGCFLFNSKSTGHIYMVENGIRKSVQRISYILARGEYPRDMQVSSYCGHKNCINPKHLECIDRNTEINQSYKANRGIIGTLSEVDKYTIRQKYKAGESIDDLVKIYSDEKRKIKPSMINWILDNP